MMLSSLGGAGSAGLLVVLLFFVLMLVFGALGRRQGRPAVREIAAFSRLRRGIGLAVEAGKRVHVSLGNGGISGPKGTSALIGLSLLQRVARVSAISDRPPIASSGEASIAILSQDSLSSSLSPLGESAAYGFTAGRFTGSTPYAYAAGAVAVIYDEHTAVNLLTGSFGSEVALLTDAAERNESLTLAGSENLTAQAVLYATADEPLIGEELYAAGAYIQAGRMHLASLRVQDLFRWGVILFILVGAAMKFLGVL